MKELEKLYYKGGKLLWPAPGTTRITSGFGYRVDPFTGKPAGHNGLDIGANPPGTYGSPIVAAESGVVITAAYLRGYGNTVIINHGGGIWTLYGHNQKLLVKEGQEVKRGDTIALMGSTGRSTGPHVHFTVYKNQVPVDPMPYLK
ncbi:M23 family metallopeptidase [Microaerobacter geothermalis]|nr:M23 family metallopeptidase [Microaerobacter geothermalis]